MTANSSGWGRCIFPEIRISLPETRRTSAVMLPPIVQVAALLATIAGLAGLAILGYSRFAANRLIAERDAAVIQAQTANAALRTDIAGLQEKIAAAARKRRETEDRLTAATNETAKLRDRLAGAEASLHALQVQQSVAVAPAGNGAKEPAPDARAAQLAETLDQTKLALHQAAAEGATLSARLSKTEADRADERAQYEATTKQLQSVIGELERELLRRSAASRKLAAAEPPGGTTGLVEGGGPGLAGVARILASAGVDVAQVFSRFGIDRGEGGPFVAPRKAAAPARSISPRQLAALRRLMQSLPLGTPVAHYQIGSPFGARTDPLNGRPAVHTGIDFDAPYLSPVYATAPGTVVFAGRRGEYGKVVEIDH
ncbi:MAG TPA: peptidoglycan DD-metalloendopeptidase family protein, partial [Stellaceae bacterium]|nr:peptidoglycan DD-metalloendopeptidase family protein [Stellaceae bacterium]